jgi:DNA gyrase subunit A
MFVTSAHTRRCCSSQPRQGLSLKVWKLPEGGPPRAAARWSTCCRAGQDETIQRPALPEDEAEWGGLSVVFATAKGNVRRNSMDAFANVPSNGKFAMKFEGEDPTTA